MGTSYYYPLFTTGFTFWAHYFGPEILLIFFPFILFNGAIMAVWLVKGKGKGTLEYFLIVVSNFADWLELHQKKKHEKHELKKERRKRG